MNTNDTIVLDGFCKIVNYLDGQCSITSQLDGNPFTVLKVKEFDYYVGAYEVTPSANIQTLSTADLMMQDNVTINPIPSNYGLITWNGSALTVS
ncbi:MAG: hypothetical protein K6F23_03640 [Solobacterium sp.]|nr:hypothetical protein [Solobacterium sp.]